MTTTITRSIELASIGRDTGFIGTVFYYFEDDGTVRRTVYAPSPTRTFPECHLHRGKCNHAAGTHGGPKRAGRRPRRPQTAADEVIAELDDLEP